MSATAKIKALLEGKATEKPAISGWLHMPLVDRDADAFVAETIRFTDENGWDFIKIMSNAHYYAEAFGADIEWSTKADQWFGTFKRYPIASVEDAANLQPVSPDQAVLARETAIVKKLKAHYGDSIPLIATIFSPLMWVQEMSSSTDPKFTIDLIRNHPDALKNALEAITKTTLDFLDRLIDAGIDGIFLATPFLQENWITKEEFRTYERPYDERILDYIENRTWFNLVHVHGSRNLDLDAVLDYKVQALNWESNTEGVPEAERASLAQVAAKTDKLLITGIDQEHDFLLGSRKEVKQRLSKRLKEAVAQKGDAGFIFAPGCGLPINVDRGIYTLIQEVVAEA